MIVTGLHGRDRLDAVFGLAMIVVGFGMGVAMLALGWVVVRAAWDQWTGPYLVYRPGRRTFDLPRAGLVLPRSAVCRWRVVTGNRVGPKDGQVWRDTAHSELHLIVDAPSGPTAYLICGWLKAVLDDSVRELARATDLPLDVVRQPDVTYPPLPVRYLD